MIDWSLLRKFGRSFRRYAKTPPTLRPRRAVQFECLEARITPADLPPAGSLVYFQTNAAGSALGRGDWYTNSANGTGAGSHYVAINVPSGWPLNVPIRVDLFSPEMNGNAAGLSDESDNTSSTPSQLANWLDGTVANTQFELYRPGTAVGPAPNVPGPGAPGSLGAQTYAPSTAAEQWERAFTINPAVTGTGTYILRAASGDDDQNGWRLRVGSDADSDPTNAPPANSDNPDGVAGTNDEITLSIIQTSFQHDVSTAGPGQVLVLYEYVRPGQPSVAFHNFDMDGNQAVRYYAPGAAFDPLNPLAGGVAGTVSTDSSWNTGSSTSRGTGDVINNPQPGWWRIATGTNSHNQFIQEGQLGAAAFYAQPPTPRMTVSKTDGTPYAGPGQLLTYTVSFANVSDTDPFPGAALNVVLTDTLPANTTFVSAQINGPYTGSTNLSGGTLTATLNGWVNAGAGGTITVTVRVNPNVTSGTVVNSVSLSYTDGLGDPIAPVTATDTDTVTYLSGFVYSDANDDGLRQAGEPGLAGVRVVLLDSAGASVAATDTAADGSYLFPGVAPGNYTITEQSQPAGYLDGLETRGNTTPLSGSVGTDRIPVTPGASGLAENDFGELLPAGVTGSVYVDANGNGIRDASESPLAGVSVTLTGTDDLGAITPVTVQTDNTGLYQFTNLRPGTYTATEPAQPAGYLDGLETADNVSPIPGTIGTDFISGLTVGAGVADGQNNFGERPLPPADLRVTKTDGATTYTRGSTVVYTVVVTNAGPTDVTGARVQDALPPQVQGASWTANYSGGSGPPSGSGSIDALVDLPNGASVTFTVTVQISATATGDLVNTASVTPPGNVRDPDGSNDSATDTDTLNLLPQAVDDTATTNENTPVTVAGATLLANDDQGDAPATVTAVSPASTQGGTVTLNADGSVTYTPPAGFSGTDTFTYTIADSNGDTSTATVTVTVQFVNSPPTATDNAGSVTEDGPTTHGGNVIGDDDGFGVDSDPDDDVLSVSAVDGQAGNVGNTVAGSYGSVVVAADGSYTYTLDNTLAVVQNLAPGETLTDTFTYTVSDGNGGTATANLTITINGADDFPVAVDDTATTDRGAPVTIGVLPNDTLGDQPTRITAVGTPGNGTAVLDDNGTPADPSDDRIVYTPKPGFYGTDTFTYTITDHDGDPSTATVTVFVDAHPLAVDDNAGTTDGTPLTVSEATLLANDDQGNAPATVTAVSPTSSRGGTVTLNPDRSVTYTAPAGFYGTDTFAYTITDTDGETSTATVTVTVNRLPLAVDDSGGTKENTPLGLPTGTLLANDNQGDAPATVTAVSPTSTQGGTVTLQGRAGTVTYTPAAGFSGTDTFTYTITDANGDTSTATVTVTVDAVPTAVDDSAATKEDTPVTTGDVLANDDQGTAPATITAFDPTSTQGGTVASNGDGTFTYTPAPNFFGTDTFTYTITDANGDSSTATVTITVDAVPDAVNDAAATKEDAPVTIPAGTLLANDDQGTAPATVTAVSATSANGGTVTLGNGVVTYTPPANFSGTDTFTYTITDTNGDSSTATVTVTVDAVPDPVNDAASTQEGAPVTTGSVLANDDQGDAPATVTAFDPVGTQGGAVVSNGNGTFTYTPAPGFTGTDTFTYTITDSNGDSGTATVTVTVVPLGRTASAGSLVWVDYDGDGVRDPDEPGLGGVSLSLTWAGPDGNFATPADNVTYTATTAADGSFSVPNLPPGTYRATVTGGLPAGVTATSDLDGGADATAVFALADGQARLDVNFGFRGTSSVSGLVFRDYHVNGAFEPNAPVPETGVGGVTVTLTGHDIANNAVTRSAVTAADGTYGFGGLLAGTYSVTETPPPGPGAGGGFYDGLDAAGSAGGTVGTNNITGVNLGTAVSATGYTFGLNPPADPFGFVWDDLNHNGRRDAGEPGIAGVRVTIGGVAFAGTPLARTLTAADAPSGLTVVTDATGRYEFSPVPPGLYTITETQPAGYIDGAEENADPNGPFTVVAGNDVFSNIELSPFPVRGPFNFGETLQPRAAGPLPAMDFFPAAPAGEDPSKRMFLGSTPASADSAGPVANLPTTPTFSAFSPSANRPPVFSVVAEDGGSGWVRVFDFAAGQERFRFQPFGDFTGGVRVATADVTGDGVPDIIAAAGPGGGPLVKVFDGSSGAEVASAMAFEPGFRGGLQVAAGDFNGDGVADIVLTPDAGGGPIVRVLDGRTLTTLANFFALDETFRGGLRVAAGDVNRDGTPDLVVTAGVGGGPRVAVYDGKQLLTTQARLFNDFFGFAPELRDGFWVSAADVDGDGFADVVMGAGNGGAPRVAVYSGRDLVSGNGPRMVSSFFASDPAGRSGARVAAADLDGDGRAEVVGAGGAGSRPAVGVYDPLTGAERDEFYAFPTDFLGGVNVG